MNLGKTNSIIILLSATSFSSIILYLQKIQTNYNPTHQLMSELALGRQGQLMLVAFTMLAIAVAGRPAARRGRRFRRLFPLAFPVTSTQRHRRGP